MKSVRALAYLWTRQLVNGIKRSLSSGRRILGIIFFLSYYFWMFLRPFGGGKNFGTGPIGNVKFDVPQEQGVLALSFGLFALMTMFLSMGILGYKSSYKSSDVDVLFPTPISPKVVLGFRMLRDTLLTIIVPLIMTIIFFRPASASWMGALGGLGDAATATNINKLSIVAYFLMSSMFTAAGYAVSLFINRPLESFEPIRRWSLWIVLGVLLTQMLAIFLVARGATTVTAWIGVGNSPLLHVLFFPATAAMWLAMSPVLGFGAFIAGFLGLLGATALFVHLAVRQHEWLYEQAAVQTEVLSNLKAAQKAGDSYAMFAQRAKDGKFKVKRAPFFQARWLGPKGLFWKDAILQWRTSQFMLVLFTVIGIGLSVFWSQLPTRKAGNMGYVMLGTSLFILFMGTSAVAQAVYLEMLKRVDLLKPLPFSSAQLIFRQILSTSVIGTVAAWCGLVAGIILQPSTALLLLAGILMAPSMSMVFSAAVCTVTVLFPDVEDPTQRSFRGMMTLVGFAIFSGPSIALFTGLAILKVSPLIGALVVTIVNLGIAWLGATISGRMFADYNPSE